MTTDPWGDVMSWLGQAASGAGDYFDNLVGGHPGRDQSIDAEAKLFGYVDNIERAGYKPAVTRVTTSYKQPLYDSVVKPGVGILAGIGKGFVDLVENPLAAVQDSLSSIGGSMLAYDPFDPFGIAEKMKQQSDASRDRYTGKYDDTDPDGVTTETTTTTRKDGNQYGPPHIPGTPDTVTETVDGITNVYNYYYDPQASQAVESASNDGLFGGGGGSMMMMMLMMMMMMPMMGGFGGLQQTIKAEPKQADISGLFYG